MKKKTILSIVALLIVILAIFGIIKFVGSEGKGEGETVVVTHYSGETTVNKNSKRIVVFDFGILDSLDKLNVQGIFYCLIFHQLLFDIQHLLHNLFFWL